MKKKQKEWIAIAKEKHAIALKKEQLEKLKGGANPWTDGGG